MNILLDRYEVARKDLLDATYFFYERIAFYSAGTISLSITFVGYLASKSGNILFKEIWFIKIYQLLIVSWTMLLISLLLGIALRLWATAYAARAAHKNLLSQVMQEHVETLIGPSLQDLKINLKRTSHLARFFEVVTKHAGWISTTCFILGIVFMLTFVITSFLKL
jgi:hypothetical protein